MTVLVPEAPVGRLPSPIIPPLESGDRLTRSEFEGRYNAMPELKKAELVEGVVYLPSPVRCEAHGAPHADLICWLGVYRAATPGVLLCDNSTVGVDLDNVVQQDALLLIEGGQARDDSKGYLEGAPEFVAEVAATTASIDLNAKFHVYRRNKVREYLVWRMLDTQLDWFILRGSEFERLAPDAEGVFRSEVFPGLSGPSQSSLTVSPPRIGKSIERFTWVAISVYSIISPVRRFASSLDASNFQRLVFRSIRRLCI